MKIVVLQSSCSESLEPPPTLSCLEVVGQATERTQVNELNLLEVDLFQLELLVIRSLETDSIQVKRESLRLQWATPVLVQAWEDQIILYQQHCRPKR